MKDELKHLIDRMQTVIEYADGSGGITPYYTDAELARDLQMIARRILQLEEGCKIMHAHGRPHGC